MSNKNDFAFPVLDTSQTPNGTNQLGLTKREYFAGLAMQGLIACPDSSGNFATIADDAISFADALLERLEK